MPGVSKHKGVADRSSPAVKLVWLFSLLLPLSIAFGKPLSEEVIRNAKRVILYRGTFDPVNDKDLQAANQLIRDGQADVVLLMPSGQDAVETLSTRTALIEVTAGQSDVVSFPESPALKEAFLKQAADKDETFSEALRKINPALEVKTVERDILNDVASAAVLENLRLEPRLFVDPRQMRDGSHALAVPDSVKNYIQTHGTYLNDIRLPKPPPEEQQTRNELIDLIHEMDAKRPGVGQAAVKKKYAEALAIKDVKELKLGEKTYEVIKWIGSGSMANAYLVKDGDRVLIAKVANHLSESAELSRQTVAAHLWLAKHGTIQVPELVDYSPNGSWTLSSFVQGPTLSKWLRERKTLTADEQAMLRGFYERCREIQRTSNLYLDIAADNIIIHDGVPVLVDTGPLPIFAAPSLFPDSADTAIKRWKDAAVASSAETDGLSDSLQQILCRFDFSRIKPYR